MKSKRVQIIALFAFVITIIFIAQVPNGFGHDPYEHPPEFYVNCTYGDYDGVEKTDNNLDPRDYTDYYDSNGNGTISASSWYMRYYASGVINGNHKYDDDAEMVYAAQVSLSASAGNSSCSGTISPSLTQDMGLTSGHPGWSGTGTITLNISDTNAHSEVPTHLPWPTHICIPIDVGGSSYESGSRSVDIKVSDSVITEITTKEIGAEVSGGNAKISGKWTGSVSRSVNNIHSYPVGFEFTLTSGFWDQVMQLDSQQNKGATVTGNLSGSIAPTSISADFQGSHTCLYPW